MGPVQGCLVPGVRNVPSTPSPRHPVRCADQRPRRGGVVLLRSWPPFCWRRHVTDASSHLIALVATGDSRVATISFTKRKKKGLACTVEQHGGGSEPMLRAVRRYRTFYVASANDTWFSTQLICAGKPGNLRLRQLPERRFFFLF